MKKLTILLVISICCTRAILGFAGGGSYGYGGGSTSQTASTITATDANGLSFTDDAGNLGLKILDGGDIEYSDSWRQETAASVFVLYNGANEVLNMYTAGTTIFNKDAAKSVRLQATNTEGAPLISEYGDNDTGIFLPSADNLAISTGGAEAMRIDENTKMIIGGPSSSGRMQINRLGSESIKLHGDNDVVFNQGGLDYDFRIEGDNNSACFVLDAGQDSIGINTLSFDGTARGVLAIANGTAPASGTADQSYIYAKDVSSSSELHVMDEAGNETQISPHDPITGDWVFYSKNVKTGRVVRVNMENFIRKMEEITGEKFIEEWVEK